MRFTCRPQMPSAQAAKTRQTKPLRQPHQSTHLRSHTLSTRPPTGMPTQSRASLRGLRWLHKPPRAHPLRPSVANTPMHVRACIVGTSMLAEPLIAPGALQLHRVFGLAFHCTTRNTPRKAAPAIAIDPSQIAAAVQNPKSLAVATKMPRNKEERIKTPSAKFMQFPRIVQLAAALPAALALPCAASVAPSPARHPSHTRHAPACRCTGTRHTSCRRAAQG